MFWLVAIRSGLFYALADRESDHHEAKSEYKVIRAERFEIVTILVCSILDITNAEKLRLLLRAFIVIEINVVNWDYSGMKS